MTDHKTISMSSLHRIFKCSGSAFMQTKFPQQEESEKAAEGTVFHDCVESAFGDYLFNGFPLEEALKLQRDKYLSKEMEGHVIDTCNAMKSQLEQIGPQRIKKLGLEEKFLLADDIGGTCDFAYLVELESELVLVGWDHKYGTWPVEAPGNLQLIGYACCANATKDWGPFDRAVMHINQPRVDHPEGTLRRMKISGEELKQYTEEMLAVAAKVKLELERGAPTFCPGTHCKFCAGDGNCAAQLKIAEKEAEVEFLPAEPKAKPELPVPELLSLEQKQALVLHAKLIKNFLESVEKAVTDEMNSGSLEYPELKLVRKTTRRRWVSDTAGAIARLEDLGMEEPYERKICTMNKVTKALGKKQAEEIFAEWMEKPEGAIEVAPLSDKRVPIVSQVDIALEEFSETKKQGE